MPGRRIAATLATLAGGVAALAIAVGAGYVLLAEPLEHGSYAAPPTAGRETGVPYEGRAQYQLPFTADAEILWAVEIRNPLLLPVTVTGLRPTLANLAPLIVTEDLRLPATDPVSLAAPDLEPFAPVELAAGASVVLVVRERFAACAPAHASWAPGGGLVRSALPLDVNVLGIPRSVEVELRFAILYSSPPGDCPAS